MAALKILKEKFGEEEWSFKKEAWWVVANYVEQDWEVAPVEVAVKEFLYRKKDGWTKTNCLQTNQEGLVTNANAEKYWAITRHPTMAAPTSRIEAYLNFARARLVMSRKVSQIRGSSGFLSLDSIISKNDRRA